MVLNYNVDSVKLFVLYPTQNYLQILTKTIIVCYFLTLSFFFCFSYSWFQISNNRKVGTFDKVREQSTGGAFITNNMLTLGEKYPESVYNKYNTCCDSLQWQWN